MSDQLPSRVRIVEVGPRDGLQNEPNHVSTPRKLELIRGLVDAGLTDIEVASFVHPNVVPQLADADDLVPALPVVADVAYSALIPNQRGLDRALETGIKRIVVFTGVSETFTKHNIRMTIEESLATFAEIITRARDHGLTARAYLSTAFGCPYEGDVDKRRVLEITRRLLEIGADEVAVSDTVGAAAPTDVRDTVALLLEDIEPARIALHFHDTSGTALANIYAGLQMGITTFDASVGGLGGCPFSPGATGNVATEDLVYMLDRMGIETGVSLPRLVEVAMRIAGHLGREPRRRAFGRLTGVRP